MNIAEFSVSGSFGGKLQRGYITAPAKPVPFEYRGQGWKSTKAIAEEVLRKHYPSITFEEIVGHCKPRHLSIARGHIWYTITLKRADISLAGIGRAFNRDHTTIMHGIKKHKQRMGIA